MSNCTHNIEIKVVNGMTVSYCTKCGAILSQVMNKTTISTCESSISTSLPTNGGQILHD